MGQGTYSGYNYMIAGVEVEAGAVGIENKERKASGAVAGAQQRSANAESFSWPPSRASPMCLPVALHDRPCKMMAHMQLNRVP